MIQRGNRSWIGLWRLWPAAVITVFSVVFGFADNASAQTFDVWYGNLNGAPIEAGIGERVFIDVYIQTSASIYIGDILLVLGANELYIDSLLTDTVADSLVIMYPFSQWEIAEFLAPQYAPPNQEGWFSQSFLGFARLFGDQAPWLHSEVPLRMLKYAAKAKYNPSLFRLTVEAFGPGLNSPQGQSRGGDTLGNIDYTIIEHFSNLDLSGSGTVTGTALNTDNQPVEGVIVEISEVQASDTTDINGGFYFGDVMPGVFDINFSHPDYYDTTLYNVLITSNSVLNYDIILANIDFGSIIGTVSDALGNPLSGVLVSVLTTQISDITDGSGEYQLLNIIPGTYNISFYLEGYFDSVVTGVVIEAGQTDSVNAALKIVKFDRMILYQNYPNPVITSTNIKFNLPDRALVEIKIYDILGRQVESLPPIQGQPGDNIIGWNSSGLASGVYFYRVRYLDQAITKSLIKLKY